jgi:NADH-quinone oxidoreductase subunit G
MENHPHDCPVCEEGGECHLQDMTVMTGHTRRRYRGTKRTWENQYLGPFLNHEMNRCITCYRCVRFYRDYAGGTDLQAFGSRSRMYFGRERDGVLENEFAGNLVEVCPTGVFTDKPFSASYTRKWDLTNAPSICPGCAVGCNTFVSERYGLLKRVQNRYHGELNGYFLCDRGRFGAGFVNAEDRLKQVGARADDDLFDVLTAEQGLARLAGLLQRGDAVGIGSPRASVETNTALRQLVGKSRFCGGTSDSEAQQIELMLALYRACASAPPSVADVEQADAILVLGEDIANTAPRIALAVRQAVRNESFELAREAGIPQWQDAGVRSHGRDRRNPLFLANLLPTRLDDIATACSHGTPVDLTDVGYAIAAQLRREIDSGSTFVRDAARSLATADRPLIISGSGSADPGVIEAAGAIAAALEESGRTPSLLLTPPEANSFGAGLLGGALSLDSALDTAQGGTLIVVENDLARRATPEQLRRLDGVADLVVLDCLDTDTASRADLVFPAATFAESTGTFVNLELRAQRYYAAIRPEEPVAPAWRWLAAAAQRTGRSDLPWAHVDEVLRAAQTDPALEGIAETAVEAGFRKVPRASHRYSGRTAMNADQNIHEPKTPVDEETPLTWSMEGQFGGQPSALLPSVWAPGWNSNQSVFKFQQEVGGSMAGGDPGRRLAGRGSTAPYPPVQERPTRQAPGPDQAVLALLPIQQVFGSDELSGRSPAIAQRAATAFVVLNPADGARLGAAEGDRLRCGSLDGVFRVRLDQAMQPGFAGLSVGLTPTVTLPEDPVAVSVVSHPAEPVSTDSGGGD